MGLMAFQPHTIINGVLYSNYERVILGYSPQDGNPANRILAKGKSHAKNAPAGATQCRGAHSGIGGFALQISTGH